MPALNYVDAYISFLLSPRESAHVRAKRTWTWMHTRMRMHFQTYSFSGS